MDPILYWNQVALEADRTDHTVGSGDQRGPLLSSRALAIVHLAMHDAYFGVRPAAHGVYLDGATGLPPGGNPEAAVAGAAFAALSTLYPSQLAAFSQALAAASIPAEGAATSKAYGEAAAAAIVDKLAIKPGEPGTGSAGYMPSNARGHHRVDPDNPAQGFYGPFYGATARPIAVEHDHDLEAPPSPDHQRTRYEAALAEIRGKGGASDLRTTTRTPEEALIGTYWGYDGAQGIGTPPRLYNQVIRGIAVARNQGDPATVAAANARLFALVNAAMGDAGKYAWKEKFRHDLWRPVLGVREHDRSMGPSAVPGHDINDGCDAFWLPLGAQRTNTTQKSFTPNFPAYPSGHATFGAAAFQMVRLFYGEPRDRADDIAFTMVSDELNGVSTDVRGTVRVRHERRFESLWQAIFENGLSRVFLGVHWHFDAFAAEDVQDGHGRYKRPREIRYTERVGGVRLGLDIANDIFDDGLKFRP